MIDWFQLSYTTLGGLGIFFFGMKMLSDSLQAISSSMIRKMINIATTNRLLAVTVGVIITVLIQSSSITTVMTVGFVNAGLMSLKQAIGVILGANIGTTITGWIIAIQIGKYSLLLIGVAIFPLLLARSSIFASWAKVFLALGFIFLGLQFMGDAFRPLRRDPGFLSLMTYFSADTYGSLLATAAMGCVLTLIIQSSSAMLGITIALATTGSITFQTAAALVMGENVGTTITAVLAGLAGNTNARRAALAHVIFNIAGVFILSLVFRNYLYFIDLLMSGDPDFISDLGEKPYIAAHIAAGHTIFNVANVILFLPFMNHLAYLVKFLIKEPREKAPKHLEFLGPQSLVSPALAVAQARKEVMKEMQMVHKALRLTLNFVESSEPDPSVRDKLIRYETITDNIHQEMMRFCGKIMLGNLTEDESENLKASLKISDELENVADYCLKLTAHKSRTRESEQIPLDPKSLSEIHQLMSMVVDFFAMVSDRIHKSQAVEKLELRQLRDKFNNAANLCRDSYIDRIQSDAIPPMNSLTIADLVLDISRIFSHTRNIAESYMGMKSSLAD